MPLSKKRNRDRMRLARATPVQPNVVQPTASTPGLIMEGRAGSLEAKLEKAGIKIDGNRITDAPQSTKSVPKEQDNTELPLYNPAIHQAGDRVLIKSPHGKRLIEMTIPQLDSEGNPIYEEG